MELVNTQNNVVTMSTKLSLQTLHFILKRLRLLDSLKISDIHSLKSCLISFCNISVLGCCGNEEPKHGEKNDLFNTLVDVISFCKYILGGDAKYEITSELQDELFGVLKLAVSYAVSLCAGNENCVYQQLQELFAALICTLRQKHYPKEDKSLNNIKQIGSMLDVIEAIDNDKRQLLFDGIESDLILLCQEVQKILLCANDLVTSHIMTYIFPVMRLVNKKIDILRETWKTVTLLFHTDLSGRVFEESGTAYLILCCLIEYCYPAEKTVVTDFVLHEDEMFWKIIQHGLVHNSTIIRKRTMFVLKRILLCCDINSIDYTRKEDIFLWSSDNANQKAVWEDLIAVFESLEEKQVHVIKPLLPKVDNLIRQTNGELYLHPSWIMEVFHRMVNHESKFIVRWAVFHILEFDLKSYPYFITHIENFIPVLMKSLNDASLYSRCSSSPIGSCSQLGLAIKLFFEICYSVLSCPERQAHFFNFVLTCMHEQSWGGVALMNISYALSELSPAPLWDETAIEKIKDLILNALRTQHVLLRGAIQCYLLKSFIILGNMKSLTFKELSKLLIVLRKGESLHRGVQLWSDVAKWINTMIVKGVAEEMTMSHAKEFCFNFLKNSLSIKAYDGLVSPMRQPPSCNRMARLIMLLADACNVFSDMEVNEAYLKPDFPLNDMLQPVIDILATARDRPYISCSDILFCLEFVSSLLDESDIVKSPETVLRGCASKIVGTDLRRYIRTLIYPHLSNILTLVSEAIIKGSEQHLENITIYLKAFEMLMDEEKMDHILPTLAPFIQQSIQIILSKQTTDTVFKQKCCWSYLACIYQFVGHMKDQSSLVFIQQKNMELIESCINLNILEEQTIKPSIQSDKLSQKAWRYFVSNAEADQWRCLDYYLRSVLLDKSHRETLVYITKQALHSLDVGSRCSVIPILHSLRIILPLIYGEEELFVLTLERAWKACNEFRKNELFKPAVEAFVQMAYQSEIMLSSSSSKYLNQYSSMLMEATETSSYGFTFLVQHCSKIWRKHFCVFHHLDILISALTFGPIYRKDQRITNEAAAFIASHGHSLSINQLVEPFYFSSTAVRITAINFLRMLSPSVREHQMLAEKLVSKLIDKNIHVSSTKSRHFGNSLIHRVKTRAWQSIFLLEGILSKEKKKQLLESIYLLLIEENHQPSVRYLLEWLTVKMLLDQAELQDEFMDHFQKAAKKRIGSVVSFLSIVIHLCTFCPCCEREYYLLKWIPLVIPWAMGQNFNTRIYAQLALLKFFFISNNCKYHKVLDTYRPLFSGIQAVDSGNVTKNTEKLLGTFYFSVFHPVHHFSLETIFYDLPRLSSLTDEEWISPNLFGVTDESNLLIDSLHNLIPVFNIDSKLRDSEASSWVLKTSDAASAELAIQDEPEETSNASNFQKKITSWKQVIPDLETLQEIGTAKKQWKADGLIVVASLIDRAPNLGGLCRTCEIFGVSEYVLGSLKYTEDKQFQNLCVSADRWVPLREVKPHCLKEYLLEMKQHGYTLIGVEQTDHSQSLQDFKFPQKSLLLLGNEKEGLPTDLIHLLDICVEIPQCGIIRSLNVHVSGAILIWEYARQHNFSSPCS